MTLGVCSGVCLCFYLCSPCNAVWGMAILYVIACAGLSMGSQSMERGGVRGKVAALGGGRCETGELVSAGQVMWRGPSHGWAFTLAPPWLQSPLSFLPDSSGHPGILPLACSPWASHCWENALWEREWLPADHDNSKHFYSNNCYLFVQRYKAGKEVKCLDGCSFKSSLKYVVFLMKCWCIWQPQTDPTISRSHRLGCDSSSLAT